MNQDGFAPFFRLQYPKMVLLLMTMGASRADAEDAVQEAMVAAWRQWECIHKPAAWVRTTAVRTFWKQNRKQVPVPQPEDAAVQLTAGDLELAVFAEEQRQVIRLLRGLAPEQRAVAALFYDGLTASEIADLTGKPVTTVRSHLRHARKSLKAVIFSDRY